jgi:hypothetical protein
VVVTPEHTFERCDQRLRHRIVDLVDPQLGGTAHGCLRRVRFRHLLGQREDGRVQLELSGGRPR